MPLNNSLLIGAAELRTRLAQGELFALIDVRERAQWQQATLPGACHLNVYDYFIPDSSDEGIVSMAHAFYRAWQALIIGDNVTPVFFEQQVGMRSPRGVWFTQFAGISGALLLDGGVDAWVQAGGALLPGQGLQAEISAQNPDFSPAPVMQKCLTATRADVLAAAQHHTQIVDARRQSEYSGEFAHECCHRAGRIPGATLLFWEDVIQDGQFLAAGELRQRAEKAGISPDSPAIIYCHRGARAATVYVALQLAGYQHLAIYVGSWHEWAEHDELPMLTGF